MQLELSKIRLDGGTQPRAKLSEETICEYAADMEAGDVFRPITVYFDGKDYWLADGFHRVEAKRRLDPNGSIDADVVQGTQLDAQWFSYSVNKGHGLRRTNEDKARAVTAALRHPEGISRSDSDIASHVGVTTPTVAKYRAKAEPTIKILKSTEAAPHEDAPSAARPRTGRDGRTINTARIGRPSSQGRKVNISGKAFTVKLGHSPPNPMIPLQFSPNNAHTAAATLFREFTREWCETLIQDLTQFLSQQEASV